MKVDIEMLAEQNIVYMRRIGAYGAENFALMERMKEWVQQNNLWNEETVIYGIAQDNPATTRPESCRYDVCLAVSHDFPADVNVANGILHSGSYAVFTIPHTSEAVGQFYTMLEVEVKKLGHSIDFNKPIMERYTNKLIDAGYCEFCVPLA